MTVPAFSRLVCMPSISRTALCMVAMPETWGRRGGECMIIGEHRRRRTMALPELYVTEILVDWRTADEHRLYDAYRLHQTLCEACFTEALTARQANADPERLFLWRLDRLESGFRLWLLSRVPPKPL